MRRPREWQGAARAQCATSGRELARTRALAREARKLVRGGAHPLAKEIASAHRREQIAAASGAAQDLLADVGQREGALSALQRALEGALSRARRTRVALAHARDELAA